MALGAVRDYPWCYAEIWRVEREDALDMWEHERSRFHDMRLAMPRRPLFAFRVSVAGLFRGDGLLGRKQQ